PDRSFVQMGQELRTNHPTKPQQQTSGQRRQPNAHRKNAMPEAPAQPPAIAGGQVGHDRVVPLPNSTLKQHAGQNRCDQNREGQRPEQSKSDGQGHGPEQSALDSLQREDRHVGGDDDGDRIEHRPLQPMCRTMFSTITTAPSTTIPKSRAPSDNRFAGILLRSSQIEANSKEKGIVSATMK